jgi:hypothetical protein
MGGEMSHLSTWGLGLGFWRAFGKGRGLPLAAPLLLIEFLFQLGNARFEFRNAGGLFGHEGVGFLELLEEFVVRYGVFTIHAFGSNFNPTFMRLTPGDLARQMR